MRNGYLNFFLNYIELLAMMLLRVSDTDYLMDIIIIFKKLAINIKKKTLVTKLPVAKMNN